MSFEPLGLVGDVGGTNGRFALAGPTGIGEGRTWPTRTLPPLPEVFRALAPRGAKAEFVCVAVAAPVQGLAVTLTNTATTIDLRTFDTPHVRLVNDLEAAAAGVPAVPPEQIVLLREGIADALRPTVVAGIGTGLGVALSLPDGTVVSGEGGHGPYAPASQAGWELAQGLSEASGYPTEWEDLICGRGFGRVAAWFDGDRRLAVHGSRAELEARAAAGASDEAHDFFAGAVGDFLRGLALTVRAGRVAVCGGAAMHLRATLERAVFARRFAAPGPVAKVLHGVPVQLLADDRLALRGCHAISRQLHTGRHLDPA